MTERTVALAADHAGLELKNQLVEMVREFGYEPLDLGTKTGESVDYPDFAGRVATAIKEGQAPRGVLVCGTGIGISIAANRHAWIRAGLVHDVTSARLCREHNDANVIVFGARTSGPEVVRDCLRVFFETEWAGGRHARRVEKLSAL